MLPLKWVILIVNDEIINGKALHKSKGNYYMKHEQNFSWHLDLFPLRIPNLVHFRKTIEMSLLGKKCIC